MSEPDRIRIQQHRASQVPKAPGREAHEPDLESSAPALRPEDLAAPSSLGAASVERIARSAGNAATASLLDGVEAGDLIPDAGRALDPALAARMEAAFGTSFGDVRVHSGPEAASNAAALQARAYTIGSDIVQGESGADDHTMAHELAHVVQNRGGSPAGGGAGGAGAGAGGAGGRGVARFGFGDLAGIASMAGPMIGMIPGMGGIGSALGGIGNAIGGGAGGLAGLGGAAGGALGSALGGGGDILSAVGGAAGSMLGGGSPAAALGGLGGAAGGALGGVLGGGGDILSGVGGVLGNAAGGGGGLVSGLEGVGESALGGLGGGAGSMLGGLSGLLGGLF